MFIGFMNIMHLVFYLKQKIRVIIKYLYSESLYFLFSLYKNMEMRTIPYRAKNTDIGMIGDMVPCELQLSGTSFNSKELSKPSVFILH